MKQKIPDQAAPCGVYCGACPSFQKSCNGCGSQNPEQKRKSKWSCKIRVCCFEKNDYSFCFQCLQFPCKTYTKKLSQSHKNDPRFAYRHELPQSLQKIKQKGIQQWLKEQKTRWQCPNCQGTITFYHYRCSKCGLEKQV